MLMRNYFVAIFLQPFYFRVASLLQNFIHMKTKFWLKDPEDHDYIAALDFLELLYTPEQAASYVEKLKNTSTVVKKSKDILRASQLQLLPKENVHVKNDIQKVKKGKKMSPILIVQDQKLVIADGYHRLCSIYYLSEDWEVPCRLAHT